VIRQHIVERIHLCPPHGAVVQRAAVEARLVRLARVEVEIDNSGAGAGGFPNDGYGPRKGRNLFRKLKVPFGNNAAFGIL